MPWSRWMWSGRTRGPTRRTRRWRAAKCGGRCMACPSRSRMRTPPRACAPPAASRRWPPTCPTPLAPRPRTSTGPVGRTVEALALLYTILAGPDGQDTDVPPAPTEAPAPELTLKNLRVAVAPTFPGLPVAAEIRQGIAALGQQLAGLGARVEEAQLPALDFGQDLASAGELIGMMVGAFQPPPGQPPATLAQYLQALGRRDQSIIAWEEFFGAWDVLLCPPAMTSAFPHCETGAPLTVDGEMQVYWMVSGHTTLFNYSGHPAVVLPLKLDPDGLPIGVQLCGRRWGV